jgi:hypothetical protein
MPFPAGNNMMCSISAMRTCFAYIYISASQDYDTG